jgi:2-methylisocitrate lyase-like PEP mutase family enzyme
MGFLSMNEMVTHAHHVAAAVSVPVIVDADTGFGNAVSVARTVKEFEAAGIAGIQIEDQVFPKRCGHFAGRDIIDCDEMVQKVRAACEARQDPDTVIIARSDALQITSYEDALKRGEAYAAAGADVVFIQGARSREQVEEIPRRMPVPTIFNWASSGQPLSLEEAKSLGYAFLMFGGATTWVVGRALDDFFARLSASGNGEDVRDLMMGHEQFWDAMGSAHIRELEQRYATSN